MSVPDDSHLAALWDSVADQWLDPPGRLRPSKQYVAIPLFRSLWGDIAGKRVLDAGCGGGWLTRVAMEDGADVDAVDFSPTLITRARQLDGGTQARYHVANLCDLSRFRDAHFDLVISHCCLQDVSNYRLALQEIARVVRTEGCMILSVVHPWTWQFDAHWGPPAPGEPFLGYIEDPQYLIERFSGRNMFHRPLSAYCAAVTSAGFSLLGLYEPRPGDDLEPVLGGEPQWERWRRVPDFLYIHAIRR